MSPAAGSALYRLAAAPAGYAKVMVQPLRAADVPAASARAGARPARACARPPGRGAGMITLLLEATPSGQRLYEKLGYVVDHETWILSRSRVALSASSGRG